MKKNMKWLLPLICIVIVAAVASQLFFGKSGPEYSDSVKNVPEFSDQPFAVINDNQPDFTQEDMTQKAYEFYSELDSLGRCGYAMACVGQELMPTEDRESISSVNPSGWVQAKYDNVDGKNLYNRCHLIGFQLTGENANDRNLITGTRYLNVEGMLPFENMIADYVKETGNHVLYRVTPVYQGNELVARGVQLEAKSVEDNGLGVCFHVYAYNNQPGIVIDYTTGESRLGESGEQTVPSKDTEEVKSTYILNKNSKKFHTSSCGQGQDIKESNKEIFTGSREELIKKGYSASKCCNP